MAPRQEDYDEFCDPENPKMLKYEEAVDAAERVKPFIKSTPLIPSQDQEEFTINLYYKLECLQKTGSFKERGAVNILQLLPQDKRKIGVVIPSLGNFAVSFCYHAAKMHVPVVVILPVTVSLRQVQQCHGYGAKVIIQGQNFNEAMRHAKFVARERGLTYINSRDHPHVLAGYASLGVEIMYEAPFVDCVVLPVGTGGLAAAVATVVKHIKPECLIYGVQPEQMPTLFTALERGEPVSLEMAPTQAHALAVPNVGVNAFHMLQTLLDKMLLVKEEWISRAMLRLRDRERYVVEAAGACPLAAIIGHLVPELKIKNVVCVLSGGNVDNLTYVRCVERALTAEAKLVKFSVGIRDTSLALAQLTAMLAAGSYNLLQHFRHREWIEDDEYYVEMQMVCQTEGLEHALELKRMLDRAYPCLVTFETEPFNDKRTCPCYVRKSIC